MSLSLSLSLSLSTDGVCSLSLSSKQGKERHDVNGDESSVLIDRDCVCARARRKREREALFLVRFFVLCRFLVNALERKKKVCRM